MAGDDHQHHGHHHHHHEGHNDNEDFTEVNRAHWNKYASSYTSQQWQKDLINKITAFIHFNVNWVGVDLIDPSTTFESRDARPSDRAVRVLDYACGPGTVTHALAGRATEYVGIDLSENMVQAYNLRFNPETPTPSTSAEDREDESLNARAVVGNLLTAQEPAEAVSGPEYQGFDLVAVGMGYHHFADLPLATRRLVDRLRPGGVFLIIDFVTHAMEVDPDADPALQAALNTVAHQGFSEAELKQIFQGAGLDDFALVRMGEEVFLKGTMKREPFMARGRKK